MAVLLIRYSEIGLKGQMVRVRWENRLKDNLMQMLEADGVEALVEKGQARLYISAGDIPAAIRSVRKVFGVSSLSVAEELDSTEPEDICNALAEYSKSRMVKGKTFAVRARREGGQKYTSVEIAKQVGDAIWDANLDKDPKVNLDSPDITFWVEVRPKRTYYFQEYIYAHAGLPLGTQGRVTAYV
ncbi:MAG: THUMP domain-containing protein, partial [Methanomethylophilus sp.]